QIDVRVAHAVHLPGPSSLEPLNERVEAQLLQPAADGVELARAELDQGLGLGDQVVSLAQPGLARVQADDDLLHACLRALVGLGDRLAHVILASTASSVKRTRTAPAARAACAVVTSSPPASSTSA